MQLSLIPSFCNVTIYFSRRRWNVVSILCSKLAISMRSLHVFRQMGGYVCSFIYVFYCWNYRTVFNYILYGTSFILDLIGLMKPHSLLIEFYHVSEKSSIVQYICACHKIHISFISNNFIWNIFIFSIYLTKYKDKLFLTPRNVVSEVWIDLQQRFVPVNDSQ